MAKRKAPRRRRRISGLGSGIFTKRNLIPAAVVVGASYFAGDKISFLNTKTGAMVEAGIGLASLMGFLGFVPKGVGLGLAIDGGKKLLTKKDWKGNAVAGIAPYYRTPLNAGNGVYGIGAHQHVSRETATNENFV